MNKNTKTLRKAVSAASKQGSNSVVSLKPVSDYHSHTGSKESFFTNRTTPTAVRGRDGIVSSNRKRNMSMKVLHNSDENGKRQSLTAHTPTDPTKFVTFKGHGYLRKDEYERNQYSQPKPVSSRVA